MVESVHHGQCGLHEGRGGAEEGDDPHPEDGAGTAEGQGRRHADDVAGAHASGQGHAEGLEGRDAFLGAVGLLLTLLGEEGADHLLETAHLDEAGAESEIQAGTDQEYDQGRTPDDVVDEGDDTLEHMFSGLLCYSVSFQ